MKIKNIVIILMLINVTSRAQVYYGVNAGANMGGIITKINGTKDKGIKNATGYIVSGDVNIPLNNKLLFQTGIQWESLHSKVNTEGTTSGSGVTIKETFNAKSSLNYINIPAKLFYRLPSVNGSFLIGAGPYLAVGISGKSKSTDITETTVGTTTTRSQYDYNAKTKFGSADTSVKRINFGAGINLCYILANNISFSAYSNIGLANINNEKNYNTKTVAYGITIGYVFGKKDEK